MTTADWALIISLGSLIIALFSFVWNIWSKFIYPKPVVKTSINFMTLYDKNGDGPSCISLNATNLGPTEVTLYTAIAREPKAWFKRKNISILMPIEGFPTTIERTNGPFSGGLPKKLPVGEQFSVFFPVSASEDWFEKNNLIDFGFNDTFGRNHWCPRKQGKDLRKNVVSK